VHLKTISLVGFKSFADRTRLVFEPGVTVVVGPNGSGKSNLVDAIVELTETGSSLRANKLRIVDTVMESVTVLIANRAAWEDIWKHQKIGSLHMLIQGAIVAREKVCLKLNVSQENLEAVSALVPALRKPTVSPLSEEGWFALESIVDESVVRDIIPVLKRAGAEGIIELPLNKIIP